MHVRVFVQRSPEQGGGSLGLDLQAVLSHQRGAGNKLGPSAASDTLFTSGPSPQCQLLGKYCKYMPKIPPVLGI